MSVTQTQQTKRSTYISNRSNYIECIYLQGRISETAKSSTNHSLQSMRLRVPGLRCLRIFFISTHNAQGKLWLIWECKMNMLILNRAGTTQSRCLPQKAIRSTPFKRSVSNVHFKRLSCWTEENSGSHFETAKGF